MWLARDFLARAGRPLDIPPCDHPPALCPPIKETAMEHRTEFNTAVIDIASDKVRVHLRCTGCDLWGQFDISPANRADRLIADIAASHNTPDLFTA